MTPQWDKTYRVYVEFETKTNRSGKMPYEVDTVRVEVTDGRRVYHLKQIVHHSPTGMQSGYGGSGPADLALTILADHFEESPALVKRNLESSRGKKRSQAVEFYQPFKGMSQIASTKLHEKSGDTNPEHVAEFKIEQAEIRDIIQQVEETREKRT